LLPPPPFQRRCQNQTYAAALEPLAPFAFHGARQRRFVNGREIEWIRYHNVVFLAFSLQTRYNSSPVVEVGEDLKYSGANTPLHTRRSGPNLDEFKNRRKKL
jgi:hypothetical protein